MYLYAIYCDGEHHDQIRLLHRKEMPGEQISRMFCHCCIQVVADHPHGYPIVEEVFRKAAELLCQRYGFDTIQEEINSFVTSMQSEFGADRSYLTKDRKPQMFEELWYIVHRVTKILRRKN